jgi:hypothetical protein
VGILVTCYNSFCNITFPCSLLYSFLVLHVIEWCVWTTCSPHKPTTRAYVTKIHSTKYISFGRGGGGVKESCKPSDKIHWKRGQRLHRKVREDRYNYCVIIRSSIIIIISYCLLCRSKGLPRSFSIDFCPLPTSLPPSTSFLLSVPLPYNVLTI